MDLPAREKAAEFDPAEGEPELIERAKRDRDAYARLYRLHYRAIVDYLYRRTGDVHATEDLASEVFLTAMQALPRYTHRGVPIRYWLLRIATNAANRWAKRRRRARDNGALSVDVADPVDSPQPGLTAEAQRASRALLSLSPKHQAVVALHYLEGLSVDQIALVVGCRPGTVKSRLSRARGVLRDKLQRRIET